MPGFDKDKLIIFDMDNTVLRSRIDFDKMRRTVHAIFDEIGCPQYKLAATARSMVAYELSPDHDPEVSKRIWAEIAQIEAVGLYQAVLEPGAAEAMAYLSGHASLAVLSNNTDQSVRENMERLGVSACFDLILGRDSVPHLKPSPDGFLQIMSAYPQLNPYHIVTVGDAANDAQGAAAANIGFIAYNNSRQEDWQRWGIEPLLRLTAWDRPSCDALLNAIPWREG